MLRAPLPDSADGMRKRALYALKFASGRAYASYDARHAGSWQSASWLPARARVADASA